MKKHNISDVGSTVGGSMFWDSSLNRTGMHVLDARVESEYSNGLDTRYEEEINKLFQKDLKVLGSGILSLSSVEAA